MSAWLDGRGREEEREEEKKKSYFEVSISKKKAGWKW